MAEPYLTRRDLPAPRGVVLMLHGGAEHGLEPVGARSRAWFRSRAMMAQLRPGLHGAGVAVWLLRYRVRGWNDGHAELPSPVPDARWALDRVRDAHGPAPVVLLGHSMGARTAVGVADDPNVVGVVALAPWFPATDPVEPLRGRRLVAAHGRRDTITAYADTEAFVGRAAGVAASARLTDMGDVGHTMLGGLRRWNRFALEESLACLSGAAAREQG